MKIEVGDIYEDCKYHPVLCTIAGDDMVTGYSLFDGSEGLCSLEHCGVYKLTPEHVAFKIYNRDRWLEAQKKHQENNKNSGTSKYLSMFNPYKELVEEDQKFWREHANVDDSQSTG